ncbi:MAG TPA: M20/M25/M40 family metallo-hydrolase [Phycisphaerae bacterium]|nr:M20/M25/M40 family metallo-hydrolase [Phycisphaerae bacterium]
MTLSSRHLPPIRAWTVLLLPAVLVPAVLVPAQESAAPEGDLGPHYAPLARRIISETLRENDAYRKLEHLCDDVGHRLSGSPGLDKAVDWAVETLKRDGHENVRTQPVTVTRWVRGDESLELLEPRPLAMPMLGLGGSVGTAPEGITAEVLVVRDLEELNDLGEKAAGKIVLFNFPMASDNESGGGGYGAAVRYRVYGARWASSHGALAALVRSVTTRSFQSPHTGAMTYVDAERRIPAAAITVEHAEYLARLQARNIPIRVRLRMEARTEGNAPSANVIAELVGRELPEEYVVIGGHLDSWDVGQGAHDDGGGVVTAMEAITVLRRLGLRPRRTIRCVLFTNEENGLAGGRAYASEHAADLPRHVAAIEADSGVFAPTGFGLDVDDPARRERGLATLRQITALLRPIGADDLVPGHGGADISPMKPAGVPLIGQRADMTYYFDIHHTHADTFDKVNRDDLSRHVAAMAVMSYILADMPARLGD